MQNTRYSTFKHHKWRIRKIFKTVISYQHSIDFEAGGPGFRALSRLDTTMYNKGTWCMWNPLKMQSHLSSHFKYTSGSDVLSFRILCLIPVSKLEDLPCSIRCHHLAVLKQKLLALYNRTKEIKASRL